MKRQGNFTIRISTEDRQEIEELAQLLGRKKGDAIRFAVKRVIFEKRHPEFELAKLREELKGGN